MFNFDFKSYNFSCPGYLRCTLPEPVKTEVCNEIEKISKGKLETTDVRGSLAGHLQKETSFPITEKLNYLLSSLCSEYDNIFYGDRDVNHPFHDDFIKQYIKNGYNFEYVLRNTWINYAKKHDFNPLHKHSGMYSFVLWVKIPYKFEDEKKQYPFARGSGDAGKFLFCYPQANLPGGVETQFIHSVDWDLILFPSNLFHGVQPFYTSDEERISISGNLFYEPVKKKTNDRTKRLVELN